MPVEVRMSPRPYCGAYMVPNVLQQEHHNEYPVGRRRYVAAIPDQGRQEIRGGGDDEQDANERGCDDCNDVVETPQEDQEAGEE